MVPDKEADELFGENLGDRVKELTETNKVRNQITANSYNNKASRSRSRFSHGGNNSYQGGNRSKQRYHPYSQQKEGYQRRRDSYHKGSKKVGHKGNSSSYKKHYHPKKVSTNWENFVQITVENGIRNTENFQAGQIRHNFKTWQSLTSDKTILTQVLGCHIELQSEPNQNEMPKPYRFSAEKKKLIDVEIHKMQEKGVIERTRPMVGQYISNIFTREKSDGSLRIILDLSHFNEEVVYRHFKMDSLQTAINLMSQGAYMASIDWRDAYYSVPVAIEFRKYLCFEWRNELFQYTC